MPDQIQREDVRAQTEPFAHVTRQARAQITGAGADEHRVDFRRRASGILQGAVGGFRRQRGRVFGETRLKRVGRELEYLRQRVEGQVARGDAVVAAEHLFKNGTRA